MASNIVDIWQVLPAAGAPAELLLPLLHSDMIWLPFHYTNFLFFYDLHSSESRFLNTILPNLKKSLSLTLKHFPLLAGKLVVPLSSGVPVSRYIAGDSVALTIAVSGADFGRLTGDDHYLRNDDFVSQIPPPVMSRGSVELTAAAIQVTLFPGQGISVAFNLHHAVGDGASLFRFVRTWASISKFNGDAHLVALGDKFTPFYDRSSVQEHAGMKTIAWPASPPAVSSHNVCVEARFVLSEAVLRKMKNFIANERKPGRISSFVAATAYMWSCAVKSAAAAGETLSDDDDEAEYFLIPADYRARQKPALPDTYFGNCLAPILAESTHGALKGKGGFVAAAEAIAKAAINRDLLQELGNLARKRTILLAGSPTFDVYGLDFGWGRPHKFIHPSTHKVFISKSRDGGVEIGLRMPKLQMEAFAAIFNHGLNDAAQNLHARSSM